MLMNGPKAADAAAEELRNRFGRAARGVHVKSTATDPVSEADVAAESAIRDVLASRRPEDAILGEEGGATGAGDWRWLVDPLDGTVNFLYGIPAFAVSVACEDSAGPVAGVVLDPVRDECFTATRSGQATLPWLFATSPFAASQRTSRRTVSVETSSSFAKAAMVAER